MTVLEMPWEPPVSAALPADPPLKVAAADRTPALLRLVVAQFRAETSERYRRRDVTGDGKAETWCNVLVRDVCEAYGAPVPALLANDLIAWFASLAGQAAGWVPCTEVEARRAATFDGQLAVPCWLVQQGHGHVAIAVPSDDGEGLRIAQAGRTNFSRGTLAQASTRYPSRFFLHHHQRVTR